MIYYQGVFLRRNVRTVNTASTVLFYNNKNSSIFYWSTLNRNLASFVKFKEDIGS